ncbi:MAG: radical SAM family heme chaperone HemW [Reichenbachiella sp.]|uniref:radical SAM family heme chaperone HemW n=1 Tax=Reichenbachiella sp. TaxID=2184521 RepID=UPI003265F4B2
MAGIYVHIPYCKQACHYCDFHFSTNLTTKSDLIEGILKEIDLQKKYLAEEIVETIYFGGGTPSLLSTFEFSTILERIRQNFLIGQSPEITLEANPDDLTSAKLAELKSVGVNRLSIGIQSFDDDLLSYFNRAHDNEMAVKSVREAKKLGFTNLSIDLIFGAPDQSLAALEADLDQALKLRTPHISIYGLTIEENTVFGKWQKQNKLNSLDDDIAAAHLELIMETLENAGYIQYEISNFCLPGFESKHNSSYWYGTWYLGIGPAAHSYNGKSRQYNQAHNIKYIQGLKNNELPFTIENLSEKDQINEFIITQIRLKKGIDCQYLIKHYSFDLLSTKSEAIENFNKVEMLETESNFLRLTPKGKLLADFITEKLII